MIVCTRFARYLIALRHKQWIDVEDVGELPRSDDSVKQAKRFQLCLNQYSIENKRQVSPSTVSSLPSLITLIVVHRHLSVCVCVCVHVCVCACVCVCVHVYVCV